MRSDELKIIFVIKIKKKLEFYYLLLLKFVQINKNYDIKYRYLTALKKCASDVFHFI